MVIIEKSFGNSDNSKMIALAIEWIKNNDRILILKRNTKGRKTGNCQIKYEFLHFNRIPSISQLSERKDESAPCLPSSWSLCSPFWNWAVLPRRIRWISYQI